MTTNEFERDLDDQAGLKRPGRIDMRVFQNTADAGDGHPGVQRCFRNYLHEGGMEKDLDLLGYSIKGTSVNINNAEMQQLSNIGTTTISPAQWIFVGEANQAVKQTDSPTFNGLTLSSLTVNGSITITGNVDSVDVSDLKTAFDAHTASTGSDHTYIDQAVTIISSPRFVNLNIEDVIQHFGDADNEIQFGTGTQAFQVASATTILDLNSSGLRIGGANVRVTGIVDSDDLGTSDVILCTQGNTKAYVDAHAGATGESHTYIDQSVKQADSPTFVGLTLSANLVTTSTIDGVDVLALKSAYDNHYADNTRHQDSIANVISSEGYNGFIKAVVFGDVFEVACSDTDAYVAYGFYIRSAGTYSVEILYSNSAGLTVEVAGGIIYIADNPSLDDMAWDKADGLDCDLVLGTANRLRRKTYGDVTLSSGSTVGVKWAKDNSADGAAGNLRIHAIILEKAN